MNPIVRHEDDRLSDLAPLVDVDMFGAVAAHILGYVGGSHRMLYCVRGRPNSGMVRVCGFPFRYDTGTRAGEVEIRTSDDTRYPCRALFRDGPNRFEVNEEVQVSGLWDAGLADMHAAAMRQREACHRGDIVLVTRPGCGDIWTPAGDLPPYVRTYEDHGFDIRVAADGRRWTEGPQ